MFVLGMVSVVELLMILLGGWLALRVGGKLLCLLGRGVPLAVLGVAAIIGGVALFAPHTVSFRVDNDGADPVRASGEGPLVERDLSSAAHASPHGWSVQRKVNIAGAPKWLLVSLGTILIISGALLAGRGRTGPATIKVFTALGIAAILFSVVNFFGSSHNSAAHRERVITVARSRDVGQSSASEGEDESALAPQQLKKSKRHSRARRPASRPERPSPSDDLVATLPKRAGEIPVELSPPAADAVAQPATPQPATPQPATSQPAASPAERPAEAAPPAPSAPEPPTAPDAAPPVATQVAEAPPPAEKPQVDQPTAQAEQSEPAADQRRPAWVDAPAKLLNGVYSIPVASGLFASVPECQHALDLELKRAADQYIVELLDDPQASELVAISLDYLKLRVKKAEYDEIVRSESVGPMHQIHALLEFDDDVRADFRHLRHDAIVVDRLWYAGSGAALVLALLGTVYGYLKLDLRSGGANKARLQLAATLVALISAAGILLVRWAVPF